MAMLVEAGVLSLDDPVSKYLPEFKELWVCAGESNQVKMVRKAKNTMTVRMVMNHMSGLPFELPNYETMGGWSHRMPLRSVAVMAAAQPLLFEPGVRGSYSNLGIDVGAANMMNIEEELPAEWRGKVEVEAKTCLELCEKENLGGAPYVRINDTEIMSQATPEKLLTRIGELIEGAQ